MRKPFWLRRTVIHSALTRVALVLLIVAQSTLTGSLAAQTLSAAFKGEFKLPYEVQWQGRTVPAGEYHFTLSSSGMSAKLIILDVREHTVAVLLPTGISDHQSAKNELRVVRRNGQSFVQSLYLDSHGRELRFLVPERPREEAELMAFYIPVQNEKK